MVTFRYTYVFIKNMRNEIPSPQRIEEVVQEAAGLPRVDLSTLQKDERERITQFGKIFYLRIRNSLLNWKMH